MRPARPSSSSAPPGPPPPRPALLRPRLAALLLAILPAASLAGSDAPPPTSPAPTSTAPQPAFAADAVKAAYIANFLRFTRWPEEDQSPSAPFVVGVSGNRELEDELVRLSERQLIRDRRIRVVRLRTLRDLASCHLVFLEADLRPSAEPALPPADVLASLRDRPVLTVSDAPGFLAAGGHINLYRDGDTLRFEIAPPPSLQASRLVLHSRLLALARPAP